MIALLLAAAVAGPRQPAACPVGASAVALPGVLACVAGDLDQDGRVDVITATFDRDGRLEVRARTASGLDRRLVLGLHQDVGGVHTVAALALQPEHVAGLPLVRVHRPGAEACGGVEVTTFVSLVDGVLREALTATSGVDTPAFHGFDLAWDRWGQGVRFTQYRGEILDDGRETVQRWTTPLVLRDGVYVAMGETVEERADRGDPDRGRTGPYPIGGVDRLP